MGSSRSADETEVLHLAFEPDSRGGIWLRLSTHRERARATFTPPLLGGPAAGTGAAARHLDAVDPSDPVATERAPLSAEEVGLRLFRSLAVGDVARPLFNALESAWAHDRPSLRLRLVFDPASPQIAGVAALPWELLHDPNHGFLARSLSISVARFVPVSRVSTSPRSDHLPLRILLASANPRGTEPLDLEAERRGIQTALQPLGSARVKVGTAVARSPMQLFHELRQGGYHVLHFLGHGDVDPLTGSAVLLLGGPDDPPCPVTGRTLASALEDLPDLRLVVINACDTARLDRLSPADPFSGLAYALVRGGLPSVVAMQFPVSDPGAIAFSEALYRALAEAEPVDLAVAQGRRAMRCGGDGADDREWAAPTLFLQVPDGRILDLRPRPREPRRELPALLVGLALLASVGGSWELFDPGFPYRDWHNPPECPSPVALGHGAGLRLARVPGPAGGSLCAGVFEVTQKQWHRVMGADTDDSPVEGPDLPVTKVSLEDARAFVDTLNRLEGEIRFRLPTDSEWEWLARAGASTAYSFGDDPAELPRYGNCLARQTPTGDGAEGPAPVGSFLPNPWGLYDVHGNVFEWVESPGAGGFDGDESGERRAIRRGGGFRSHPSRCTSGARDPHDPERNEADTGLRLVGEPETKGEP